LRHEKPVPETRFQGVAFVICSDDPDRMTASPRRNSSQDMAMRMVHVEDIKLLMAKIVGNVEDVPKITPQKLRMINPDGMV
jgi:hypothetical protein